MGRRTSVLNVRRTSTPNDNSTFVFMVSNNLSEILGWQCSFRPNQNSGNEDLTVPSLEIRFLDGGGTPSSSSGPDLMPLDVDWDDSLRTFWYESSTLAYARSLERYYLKPAQNITRILRQGRPAQPLNHVAWQVVAPDYAGAQIDLSISVQYTVR